MLRDYSVLFNFLLTFKDTRTRTHTLHLHSMPVCLNVHVYIFKHIPFCSSFTLRYHYSHTFVLINYGRLPPYLKCLVLSLLGRATPEKRPGWSMTSHIYLNWSMGERKGSWPWSWSTVPVHIPVPFLSVGSAACGPARSPFIALLDGERRGCDVRVCATIMWLCL